MVVGQYFYLHWLMKRRSTISQSWHFAWVYAGPFSQLLCWGWKCQYWNMGKGSTEADFTDLSSKIWIKNWIKMGKRFGRCTLIQIRYLSVYETNSIIIQSIRGSTIEMCWYSSNVAQSCNSSSILIQFSKLAKHFSLGRFLTHISSLLQ